MNKLVSILIPVYNREHLIEETIDSALSQTYQHIEIVVVDNQSTDDTWNILLRKSSEDNRIKIFQNEQNIGPVRNWMRCINEAKGVYGKILWSDDLIAPDFLEKTIVFLEQKNVGFVFTGVEIFEDKTKKKTSHYLIGGTGIYDTEKFIYEALFGVNYPVSPGCALFRLEDLKTNLLIKIPNKVNSDFSMHAIGNDFLIFLLTAHKYKKFAFVNEMLSFFRAHEDSISIQSSDGKLPLHYKLASSYFIETYREDLIRRNNVMLLNLLRKYKEVASSFNVLDISDFYLKNKNYKLDHVFMLKKIISKVVVRLRK